MRAVANLLVGFLFLAATSAPLIGRFSGFSESSIEQTENRRAAAMPELDFKDIGPIRWPRTKSVIDFPNQFESYYNDHFGFRTPLVRTYNTARLNGWVPQVLGPLIEGKQQSSSVVVGREGWLYFTQNANLQSYRNADPMSDEELDNWANVLRARCEWLAKRGIAYIFIVPPAKATIYPQYLPPAINRLGQRSRLDQLVERMSREPGQKILVDIRAQLLAASGQHPTYFRTDSHWNDYGGFIGYYELFSALAAQVPDLRPLELGDFQVHIRETSNKDLALMMQAHRPLTDVAVELQPRAARLAQPAPLPQELDGRRWCHFHQPSAVHGTMLALHDSFVGSMMPYLNEHFQESYYYMNHGLEFPCDAIERLQPQVVIQLMTERYLMECQPHNAPEVVAGL